MLQGRLGLDTARVPHVDRQGLVWLTKGSLIAKDGSLVFKHVGASSANDPLDQGSYAIPVQSVSIVLLGPGTSVSQEALRLLGVYGTAMVAIGENGVRCYTAPPMMPNHSGVARRQASLWADSTKRLDIARRMYAWRLGRVLPHRDIAALRGIEGSRMKQTYQLVAQQIGIDWRGRRYDRARPDATDLPNQAINHAATAIEAAAAVSVAATGAIPQLGFIHEGPGQSFTLDIADLFRDDVTIPVAFKAAKKVQDDFKLNIERVTRKDAGLSIRINKVIPKMIERIKTLFDLENEVRE